MNKGRKFFSILLTIVVIITIALLAFLAYKYISNYILTKEASDIVDEFENSIITVAIDEENNTVNGETQTPTNSNTSGNRTSTRIKHKGYDVIGSIQIPKTKVKYPIVNSAEPAAMDSAIVMLYGPGLNQEGNTVLAGHNYRNGGFFGNNKKLENGDKIYITDETGNKIEYTIYNKYTAADSDFSYATRNTEGKREISLSTCTSNASTRLVIWAKEN